MRPFDEIIGTPGGILLAGFAVLLFFGQLLFLFFGHVGSFFQTCRFIFFGHVVLFFSDKHNLFRGLIRRYPLHRTAFSARWKISVLTNGGLPLQ